MWSARKITFTSRAQYIGSVYYEFYAHAWIISGDMSLTEIDEIQTDRRDRIHNHPLLCGRQLITVTTARGAGEWPTFSGTPFTTGSTAAERFDITDAEDAGVATGNDTVVAIGDDTVVATGDDTVVAIGDDAGIATGDDTVVAIGDDTVVATGDDPVVATGENTGDVAGDG